MPFLKETSIMSVSINVHMSCTASPEVFVLFHLGSVVGTSLRIISLSLVVAISAAVSIPTENELIGNN